MIPQAFIQEWSLHVPWWDSDMIEHDLIICRSLTDIFNHPYLKGNMAFRGGTAIHKLYLSPQSRYSEDIDLVQIEANPIKKTIDGLYDCLSFLGNPVVKQKANNNTLIFKYTSESIPELSLKLKIEINCREHFTVLGYKEMDFEVQSLWFNGHCKIKTFELEELLGTKLRALYQRSKGRDLYDLYKGIGKTKVDIDKLLRCYREYIGFSVNKPPTKKQFLQNMEVKMQNSEFLGDTKAILRPDENFNALHAWKVVRSKLIENI